MVNNTNQKKYIFRRNLYNSKDELLKIIQEVMDTEYQEGYGYAVERDGNISIRMKIPKKRFITANPNANIVECSQIFKGKGLYCRDCNKCLDKSTQDQLIDCPTIDKCKKSYDDGNLKLICNCGNDTFRIETVNSFTNVKLIASEDRVKYEKEDHPTYKRITNVYLKK